MLISISAGVTLATWKKMDSSQRRAYLKKYPHSRYAPEPAQNVKEHMQDAKSKRYNIGPKTMSKLAAATPKQARQAIEAAASALHKAWADAYKASNGADAKRIKKTKDQAWIAKNGTDEVDIANTDFKDLPQDWRKENEESAKSAVKSVIKAARKKPKTGRFYKATGDAVHKAWLKRNGAWAPDHQKLPFMKLSQEERRKDMDVVREAAKAILKVTR